MYTKKIAILKKLHAGARGKKDMFQPNFEVNKLKIMSIREKGI